MRYITEWAVFESDGSGPYQHIASREPGYGTDGPRAWEESRWDEDVVRWSDRLGHLKSVVYWKVEEE